jgi:hypothetical protein
MSVHKDLIIILQTKIILNKEIIRMILKITKVLMEIMLKMLTLKGQKELKN